jgi:hypothetical protein
MHVGHRFRRAFNVTASSSSVKIEQFFAAVRIRLARIKLRYSYARLIQNLGEFPPNVPIFRAASARTKQWLRIGAFWTIFFVDTFMVPAHGN